MWIVIFFCFVYQAYMFFLWSSRKGYKVGKEKSYFYDLLWLKKILSNPQEAVVIGPNFMPHNNFYYCNKCNWPSRLFGLRNVYTHLQNIGQKPEASSCAWIASINLTIKMLMKHTILKKNIMSQTIFCPQCNNLNDLE